MAVPKYIDDLLRTDRTIFWTDLAYVPPILKITDKRWMAQCIYFAKKNAKIFLSPKRAKKYRATDDLETNQEEMKKMFDPLTPMSSGGDAKYMSADWYQCPLYIHLKNTVKAEIQRTSSEIEVTLADKYAKTRKMRDNYKMLYSQLVRELINYFAPRVGLKKITNAQDPYKWIQMQDNPPQEGEKPTGGGDVVAKLTDLIKNQITSDEDLALYNEYIYKGDYEQAFEKGIKHYMFNLNKWNDRWSDDYLDDIMHFNKASGEWYTDLITGRPVVERYVPEKLWVSPFKNKDGDDIFYYFIEYNIPFSQFVKEMGKNLSSEELKLVFEYNKTQGSNHGIDWEEYRKDRLRDNAFIRVGKISVLTQDYDVFMDRVQPAYPMFQQMPLDTFDRKEFTQKNKKTPDKYKSTLTEKHYNVWYTADYIPPTTESLSSADFNWQARYIFNIRRLQDQFRFGENGRYSKSPLVVFDDSKQASFTDIVQAFMPKINFLWQRYQNCLVTDIDGLAVSDEFLGAMLRAIDEENKISPGIAKQGTGGNGADPALESWKMLRQGNFSFISFTDKQGKKIVDDPNKLFIRVKNFQAERARDTMVEMLQLYNTMLMSLSMDNTVRPRTNKEGIQQNEENTNNALYFLKKGYETFVKTYAERFIQYIVMIVKEPERYGYYKRFEEFKDIIGLANGLLIKGMEDVPPETVGLTINYVDPTAKREYVRALAQKRADQGMIDDDILGLIIAEDNWKVAMCYLRLSIKKRKKEEAAKQQLQHEYTMQEKKMDLKIAMAINAGKGEAKDKNIVTQGQMDAKLAELMDQLKGKTTAESKEQMKNNRIEQDNNKARNEKEKETSDALAP